MRIARHAALLIALVCILLSLPCQARSREWHCRINCKSLELVVCVAQQKSGKTITNLNALVPSRIKEMPVCPVGGTYILGTNSTVECTISEELHGYRPFKGINIITALALFVPLLMLWRREYDERTAIIIGSRVAVVSVCLSLTPWLILGVMLDLPWKKVVDVLSVTPMLKARLVDSINCGLNGFVFLSSACGVLYGYAARRKLKHTASRTMSVVALLGLLLGYAALIYLAWWSYAPQRVF